MCSGSKPRSLLSVLLIVSFGASIAAAPQVAVADASSAMAARRLFGQGKESLAAGKYAEACPKLEESQRLDPAAETLIELGECYDKSGRPAAAWNKLVEAEQLAHATGQTRLAHTPRERATRLSPRLSNIVIEVVPSEAAPGLEVRRDNVVISSTHWGIPIPADPGQHQISATAPGRRRWEMYVRLPPNGKTTTVRIPA